MHFGNCSLVSIGPLVCVCGGAGPAALHFPARRFESAHGVQTCRMTGNVMSSYLRDTTIGRLFSFDIVFRTSVAEQSKSIAPWAAGRWRGGIVDVRVELCVMLCCN